MKNLYYSLIIKNESKQFAYQDALDNLNIKQDFYDIDSGEYDIYLKIYDSDKKRSFRIINDTSFEDGKNYLGKIKIN